MQLTVPHIAARLYNVPLLITPEKLQAVMSVLAAKGAPSDISSLGSLISSTAAPSAAKPSPRSSNRGGLGVAVIPIIGSTVHRARGFSGSGLRSYAAIKRELNAAMEDPEVGGILLDVDSHGGEAAGCFALAEYIRGLSGKPIWAHANESAYSAGYALLSAADRCYMARTSGAGSIGVIMQHVNQAKFNKKLGVQVSYIFSGERKADGNPHQALPKEVRDQLQARIDGMRGQFCELVDRHRGLKPGAAHATEAGLFFGQEAVDAGLVDAIATWEATLAELGSTINRNPRGKKMNTKERMQALIDNNEDATAALAELGFVPQDQAASQATIDEAVQAARDEATEAATADTQGACADIVEMCDMANLPLAAAATLIRQGSSVEAARKDILGEKAALDGKQVIQSTHTGSTAGTTNDFVGYVNAQLNPQAAQA